VRLEDLGQTAKTVAGVNAQFRLPQDSDLIIAVYPLNARSLTLFVLVIGFIRHCWISSGFDKCLSDLI
jgi:hypothetical protein